MPKRLASSCGQLIMGPPGSGKTTYAHRALEVLTQDRKTVVVNLDPANESGWQGLHVVDIRQLITCEDASRFLHLGPNASFMFCLEFLDTERGRKWLVEELLKREDGTYFIFDLPGQIELVTHHPAISNVIQYLCQEEGLRMVAVHLVDCMLATDGQRFISVALLALSSMMRLALPHVNVLSKVDLLDEDDLDFPLYFYTEMPNFDMLSKKIRTTPKYRKLLGVICELLDDFNQVTFQLLSTKEEDDELLRELLGTLDKVVGYLPVKGPRSARA